MSDPPRLTVALPTCNGARHLREALAGIRAQADARFDLIVSDDRSDDDTLGIVRDTIGDRAQVFVNSERLGLAGNWNRCVERSRTEWVAIFHQDDVMHPDHLASQLRVIDDHSSEPIGIVAGPVVMIDGTSRPISARFVDPGGLDLRAIRRQPATEIIFQPGQYLAMLATRNPLRCSAVTIRKAAHQAVGGFDPSYRYVVDWDFWLRVAQDWGLAWITGPPTVSMRWHSSSETQRFKKGLTDLEETTRLLDSIATDPEAKEKRRGADTILARAYLNRAHVALKGGDGELARLALDRAIHLAPTILVTIAADPRLTVQMAALKLNSNLAVCWFGKPRSGE